MAEALGAALDALYAEPPSAFTNARDALAKSLVDKSAAAKVRALRKPSVDAYALNQIARKLPDEVAGLVDVGRALARAQRKALRGEAPGDLRDAIARQREALRGLVRKATPLLRDLKIPLSHLVAVTSALQAALVDPTTAAALEVGRLEAAPTAPTDFLGAITSLPSPRAPHRSSGHGAAKHGDAAERETAKRETAKREAAERAAAARQARVAAETAAAEAATAAAEASRLEKAAKDATARARELATTARQLAAAAKRAELAR